MTYLVNDISGQWPISSMTYLVNDLSGQWHNRSMAYPVNDVSGQWLIQSMTYPVNDLSSQWLIQSMIYPNNDVSGQWCSHSMKYPVNKVPPHQGGFVKRWQHGSQICFETLIIEKLLRTQQPPIFWNNHISGLKLLTSLKQVFHSQGQIKLTIKLGQREVCLTTVDNFWWQLRFEWKSICLFVRNPA